MSFEDFLNNKIEAQKNKNIDEFKSYLNSTSGKTKIQNFLKKNSDLDVSKIKEDALNGNPYAIAILRKDPTRQNVSEKAFFEYTGLEKLPQSGSKSIRFGKSKAADFKINNWYGTQKYIKECGGAQDNQINDAITFALEANKQNKKAIICVDGEYGVRSIKSKIKQTDNCLIVSADELKEEMSNGRFN